MSVPLLPYSDQISFLIEISTFLFFYTIYVALTSGISFTNIILTFLLFSIWNLFLILINNVYSYMDYPLPKTSRSSYFV